MLYIKSFKHCEKLFIVHVVVKLSDLECARVECDWINLLFFYYDKKDSCRSIFLYIDFYDHLNIRNPVIRIRVEINTFLRVLNASKYEKSKFQEVFFQVS